MKINKSIWFFLLILIAVAVAAAADDADHDGDEPNHGHGHDHDHDHEYHGPCGKFSPERMLTHTLRHCEKAARDESAPVSPKCCKPLEKTPISCLHALCSSGAFTKLGINPQVAATIPERCHFAKPPTSTTQN